jgi:4-oxalocrotonate tautomerase
MAGEISRRIFLTSAIVLGAAALCDAEVIGRIAQAEGELKSLSSQKVKEQTMPHIIVKLWPGKSEQQKAQLTEAIVKDVCKILRYGEDSVSVAIEEVEPGEWKEKVYKPDIINKQDKLYKKPGYSM